MSAKLVDLFNHYGSNKGATYGGLYDVLLAPVREQAIALLEIGIGSLDPEAVSTMAGYTMHDGYKPGGSLRAFRDYLPNAHISGVDNAPDTQFYDEERISTYLCDSTKAIPSGWAILQPMANVIVDDACHDHQAQIATFRNFMPLLRSGGIYVIEDVYPHNEEEIRAEIANYPFICVRSIVGNWLAFVVRRSQ